MHARHVRRHCRRGAARLAEELEHKGDALTLDLLTRIERRVIAQPGGELRDNARALDDVLDAVEAGTDAFDLFGVRLPTGPVTELLELAARSAGLLPPASPCWAPPAAVPPVWPCLAPPRDEINQHENLSDKVHREAMGVLFRQSDVALMLKWKQIYDNLGPISDRCDDVADVVQSAILHNT